MSVAFRSLVRRSVGIISWFSKTTLGLAMLAAGASGGCADDDAASANAPPAPSGPEARTPAPDALDALYARDHLLEIVVELEPADWQALRAEGRPLFDGFEEREDETFQFTDYVGAVSVDGVRYENVGIRKKGYLGSLSRPRPSLKLDFGEVEDAVGPAAGRVFERLTLNNNRQEFSRARTCLAYDLFAKAGIPAPRCNLAHVVVNGEDLGTYSNVEPIRKPMLARHFGDDSGTLYEGQLVDFVAEDVPRFELKTNETRNDRRALQSLASALQAEDSALQQRLAETLELPRFREFWAMETLTGHWDGYAGNRNNFYLYDNPASGRLEFIPWGTDGAFAENIPGDSFNTGMTVYARGLLANRLYNLPEERALFRARLAALNEAVWDASALTRELERITALAPDALPGATAALTEHLMTHGARLRSLLGAKAPEWIANESRQGDCAGTVSEVSFEFETDYGDVGDLAPGVGRFDVALSLDSVPVDFNGTTWFGRAGVEDPEVDSTVVVRALSFFENGQGILLQVSIPPEEFSPGSRALHGFETVGVAVVIGASSRFIGFISDGTLELDAASAVVGAPVSGRMNAKLLQTGCAKLQ